MPVQFTWKCSYLNCLWYEVIDETGRYEIEERRRVSDYERSISNYDADGWNRCVVAAIGSILRTCNNDKPIPPATVAAFNRWRAEEHAASLAKMRARPERYGAILDKDFPTPPVVKGARYDPESKSIVPT